MAADVHDVAIVGFGPVGATAAALLGGHGLRIFVCDRTAEIYDKPRAFALDHEIMRVFQQLGVADQVLEHAEPFTPSEFHGVDGQLIKRFTTVDPPHPLAFEPSLVFSQPDLERVLRAAVERLSTVEVALGARLVSLSQDGDGVTLMLHEADGRRREVRARHVIGCDGASSTVRALVGIALEDLGFDQPWLVVDVLVNELGAVRLPAVSQQICEPERPTTYLVGVRNHRRWEISINDGEDAAEVATPERTWALLSRWIEPRHGQLWRQASYRFHALVADDWRCGRVFVAGDAAHQQPPFLGQGMCQGIRDVANLAWKLAAVLGGEAGDSLLDSYGAERKQHVIELTTRIKAIGQLVGERDLAKARARDAGLLEACGGVVRSQPRQSVQPALSVGCLSPEKHPAVGTPMPQPWIRSDGDRQRLDELTGRGWRLVYAAGAGPAPAPGRARPDVMPPPGHALPDLMPPPSLDHRLTAVPIGVSGFIECDGVVARWFEANHCRCAIVRPDHYVWGVADSAADLERQLGYWTSQMQGQT